VSADLSIGARHGTSTVPGPSSIALVGNPNCGKTTLFNALTGGEQRVGNWPGVTVERKEGKLKLGDEQNTLVDLPGIYGLLASSEDERVARDYILSGEPALVIDIVDASNLERNLFLTTQLLDLRIPLVVVLNMMDLAEANGISVDVEALQRELGCPVVGVSATRKRDARRVLDVAAHAWLQQAEARAAGAVHGAQPQTGAAPAAAAAGPAASLDGPAAPAVPQDPAIERLAVEWEPRLRDEAAALGTNSRWLALKLLERDSWAIDHVAAAGAMSAAEIEAATAALEEALGESADIVLAERRYQFIESVVAQSLVRPELTETRSDKADRIILNRFLGIPIFFVAMYLLFWFTINVGGAFIDFFDMVAGAILVDGFGRILEAIGSPDWLVGILADGVGAGLQTVATFIPVIFAMFLGLSLLEDSGYMARAAFVMDRFMRWIGLPGKSFVPMLVGFGCNVPAIMATRTLENRRDRYLTIFMNPYMSCGARLPVYALFGAAFFGASAGAMTFSLYLAGITVAVLTGLLLKSTLFKGEPSYFVMELPAYHLPRAHTTLRQAWRRTLIFLTRAKYIVPIVAVLAILNTVGTDGTLGNEDTSTSVLSKIGQTVTPVFEPMGVEQDNWPATVGIFTGILAKETVVGSLNSLYSQGAAGEGGEEGYSFWGSIGEAVATIPANLWGAVTSLADPLGLGLVSGSGETVAEEVGASSSIYAGLRAGFSEGKPQAYAYLLFILLYIPCVAAFAAMTREMGLRYTFLSATQIMLTAWSLATLFYQVTVAHDPFWICVALALLVVMVAVLWAMGRRSRALAGRMAVADAEAG